MRDQGEQRREHQHDDQRDDEEQDVAAHHRQERQQPLHQRDVGDGAADDLAGVELVLAGAVEPVQRAEHFGAQVVLHVQGEPATHVATDEAEAESRKPAPTSTSTHGSSGWVAFSTAWSTTSRSTSGTPAWTAIPASAAPNASSTEPRYRQQ